MKKTKKIIRLLILTAFIMTVPMLTNVMGQPQPGTNGDGSTVGGNPVGGGAPIGSGIVILLSLAAGYGSKKIYDARKILDE